MKWGYSGYTKPEIRKFTKDVKAKEELESHMKDYEQGVENMLERTEKGSLRLNCLELEIFFDDLFDACKTHREIDWLLDEIRGCVECVSEEFHDNLEEE